MTPLSERLEGMALDLESSGGVEELVNNLHAASRAALAWEICHANHWFAWEKNGTWLACSCEDGAAVVPLDKRQTYKHPVTSVLEAKKILDEIGED
jgi:hypothetical protein